MTGKCNQILRAIPGRVSGCGLLVALSCLSPSPALADSSTVSIVPVRQLEFGSFVVFGSGSRQVGADGSVSGTGVFALRGYREGPAEFQITYTPRVAGVAAVVQLTMGTVSPLTSNGAQGTLDSFTTDLPGAPGLAPGRAQTLILPGCGSKTCNLTFHVGGRLSLTGVSGGGASFVFPLPMTVRALVDG